MARPRKAERRDKQLNIKLTTREHAWIESRASAANMKPAEFGRVQVLMGRPLPRNSAENADHLDPLFFAHLSRLGNNLNQIARRCHLLNAPPPASLEPLLQQLREMIRKAVAHGS